MLELKGLTKHFGGVRAVERVDLTVRQGEILGLIAGLGGGLFAHYTTHIEHVQFGVVLATFAVAYPILGGLSNVFGTLLAVIFIQGFLIEGLRFMGDWRNLLFGALIVLAMNVRPRGLIDAGTVAALKRIFNRELAGA